MIDQSINIAGLSTVNLGDCGLAKDITPDHLYTLTVVVRIGRRQYPQKEGDNGALRIRNLARFLRDGLQTSVFAPIFVFTVPDTRLYVVTNSGVIAIPLIV